eukprot:371842-Rhodomonas_salina.3
MNASDQCRDRWQPLMTHANSTVCITRSRHTIGQQQDSNSPKHPPPRRRIERGSLRPFNARGNLEAAKTRKSKRPSLPCDVVEA